MVNQHLYEINEAAAALFQKWLTNSPGWHYATEQRDLSDETIQQWGLGYAPDSWEAVKTVLSGQGYNLEDLALLGLVRERQSGGYYDTFRNRLIFPIRDVYNRIVGFAGRDLTGDENVPKYINSPRSPIFDKSRILYGLDAAFDNIEAKGKATIVEGYLDVITAHQAGFTNVVATMGTAFTAHQLAALGQAEITLALDSDKAGQQATFRSLNLLSQREGVKVAVLPKGEDPDSLIRREPKKFGMILMTADPIIKWLITTRTKGLNRRDVMAKERAARELIPHVRQASSLEEKGQLLQQIASAIGVSEEVLLDHGIKQKEEMLPLWDIEAEENVLGSILLYPAALDEVAPLLNADDFYRETHQIIYDAMRQLHEAEVAIDLVTLVNYLRLCGEYHRVDGHAGVAKFMTVTYTALHARHYAKIVAANAFKRRLIYKLEEMKRFVMKNLAMTPLELGSKCEADLSSVVTSIPQQGDLMHISRTLPETREGIEALYRGEITDRLPCHPSDLADLTGGWRRGDLIIIAARPGVGKSSLMLSQAAYLAKEKCNVIIFSQEMDHRKLNQRLIAGEAKINSRLISIGPLGEGTYRKAMTAIDTLSKRTIWTCDTSLLTVQDMLAKARLLALKLAKRGERLDAVFIDYLQIMHHNEVPGLNWASVIGRTTSGLKRMAKELDIALFCLSQLNRDIEYRQNKKPSLAHLRDSGSIEADADVVLFLWYPDPDEIPSKITATIAKHRDGPIGNRDLYFHKDKNWWGNLATEEQEEQEEQAPPSFEQDEWDFGEVEF